MCPAIRKMDRKSISSQQEGGWIEYATCAVQDKWNRYRIREDKLLYLGAKFGYNGPIFHLTLEKSEHKNYDHYPSHG